MERQVDFWHERHMLCEGCTEEFVVDLDWIDRWEQSGEQCPGCGLTCEHEDAPRVTVDPADLALNDELVVQLSWFHTSTHADWPTKDFKPEAGLTPQTRMRMGGGARVASWAARQRAKALHVGTYEAAVHNMLRRIDDQADHGRQFYLYRVQLRPSVVVGKGWVVDPSDWLGDVALEHLCPPGVDVVRYLNHHEDPGGLSLALGRGAIASVQRIAVPLADGWDVVWVREAAAALERASDTLGPATGRLGRFRPPLSSRAALAGALVVALAERLPANLRDQFDSATRFEEGADPVQWARQASCLYGLVADPDRVLAALDRQVIRAV